MNEQEILRKVLERLDALEKEVERLRAQAAPPAPAVKPSDIISNWAEAKRASQASARQTRQDAKPDAPASRSEPIEPHGTKKTVEPLGPASLPESIRNYYEPPRTEPEAKTKADTPPFKPAPAAKLAPARQTPPKRPGLEWKALLRRLNMLPPEGEGTLEIQVGTWWTVRVGIIMAVIGAVFFGIWATQHTPAWVKWTELLGISLGVCVLGLLIERKGKELAGFGGIVFAGGLALIDFTAFAAYAVPAVKIFTGPAPSFAMQMAATALIVACALWRKSGVIATMAILLGYVACLFSFAEGLLPFALTAALLLGGGAVFFYLRKGWTNPFLLAVPLTHLITALIALRWIETKEHPAFWICAGYPLLTMALYGVTDLAALLRGIEIAPLRRRLIQLLNSSGAVLIGFLITYALFNDQLDVFYFTFGSVLLAGSAVYYFMKHPDAIMHGYFVKGSALVTMGLITALDARTRWAALAIQSLVLLISARRSRLKTIEAASTITWLVSFYFYHLHYTEIVPRNTFLPVWSSEGLMAIGYFLFTCVLFGLHGRWFFPNRAPGLSPMAMDEPRRPLLAGLHAFLLSITAISLCNDLSTPVYQPLTLTILAIVLAVSSWSLGHWAGTVAGAMTLLLAHARIVEDFSHLGYSAAYWTAGLPVIVVTLVAAVIVNINNDPQHKPGDKPKAAMVSTILSGLWIFTLTIMFHRSLDHEYFLLAATLSGLAVGIMSLSPSMRRLADLAIMPLVLALGLMGMIFSQGRIPPANVLWPLWLTLAGALLIPLGFGCQLALKARIGWLRKNHRYLVIQSIAAGWIMLLALRGLYADWALMMALAVAGVLIALLRRWPGLRTALAWGIVYIVLAGMEFLSEFGRTSARDSHLFLALSIFTAICAAGLAMLAPRLHPAIDRQRLLAIQWGLGALALVMALFLFASRTGAAAHYTSVFWGLSAIALFGAGLADRIKPFRVLGLVALGLCIGRVFVVDIQSTVYRIAAFAAIGCVLLVVGFLYNRYRDIIEGIDRPAATGIPTGEAPPTPAGSEEL